jgi:hypothetical protein
MPFDELVVSQYVNIFVVAVMKFQIAKYHRVENLGSHGSEY